MSKFIQPGQTIGIIGGGQLGRMMALSAREMGYKIAVLDPSENSPCGQIADIEIVAPFHDQDALNKLATVSDVITYEFENIDVAALQQLEQQAAVHPNSNLLQMTQHRFVEKQAINQAGGKTAPYQIVESAEALIAALDVIGYPSVLKTCRFGYDGKGQYVLRSAADIEQASVLAEQQVCILEGWVPFDLEISVIVARNEAGEIAVLPVAENIHRDNILHQTIVPARIDEALQQKAIGYAKQLAEHFDLVGTLAVEMFVVGDEIYVNELAPRPHNSGHYSIDACETSQFQQHIRAVCGWPLGETTLHRPVVMANLLGEHLQQAIEHIPQFANAKLHLYGKEEAKVKRKMGHINMLGNDVEQILDEMNKWTIWQEVRI